jgi:hypothetical protein
VDSEEYYEKYYGEWLAQMAEDLGFEVEPLSDDEIEALMKVRGFWEKENEKN